MKTLLISSSNGLSTGQLATDLIVKNSTKIGVYQSQFLVPMLASECDLLYSACDLYSTENGIIVMQIRSFVEDGKLGYFSTELVNWMTQQGFERVIVLSGVVTLDLMSVWFKWTKDADFDK